MWSNIKAEVGWAAVLSVRRRVGVSLVEEIEGLESELDALLRIFADYSSRYDEQGDGDR